MDFYTLIYLTVLVGLVFLGLRSTMFTIAEKMQTTYLKVAQVEKLVGLVTDSRNLLGRIQNELRLAREDEQRRREMRLMGEEFARQKGLKNPD
jgi:hypothetical protein